MRWERRALRRLSKRVDGSSEGAELRGSVVLEFARDRWLVEVEVGMHPSCMSPGGFESLLSFI